MSDSRAKYAELNEEEARSFSGLGYTQTTTADMTKNKDVKPQYIKSTKENFKDIFECIEQWNNMWSDYNEFGGDRPVNSEELIEELVKLYKVKRK